MIGRINTFLIVITILFAVQALAKSPRLVVCYTTGSVSRRQAKEATKSMLEVLERLVGLPVNKYQSEFTTSPEKCLKFLKDKKTYFISADLGFFLTYRNKYHLKPMVWPKIKGKSTNKWYVIVRRGTYKDIKELKGKTLGGPLTNEPEFLRRVVFKCGINPEDFFVLKHSSHILHNLRRLAKGKLDAMILDNRQYDALSALPFAKDLVSIFTSDPMPVPSIFAVDKRATGKEFKQFTRALSGFCSDSKGKSFCSMFGIDAFVPVKKTAYRQVESLWGKCNKKASDVR